MFDDKEKKRLRNFTYKTLMMPFMGVLIFLGTVIWYVMMCKMKTVIPNVTVYLTCLFTLGIWLIVEGCYLINIAKTINKHLDDDNKEEKL